MASIQSRFVQRVMRMAWDRHNPQSLNVARLRQRMGKLAARFGEVPTDVRVTPVSIGRMAGEWIEPRGVQHHRVVLYLHGGGYVMGGLDTHRNMAARVALASSARALLIDYRLAPEHPFPAALEDTLAAYRYLLHQGLDPRGMAIVGDFSGGGLALAASIALKDHKAPLPGCLVAISPWTDLAFSGRTMLTNSARDALLSLPLLAYFAQNYMHGALPTNPLISPLYGNLKGLPPLLLHAGSNEVLRDDATRLSERALKAGVDVSVEVYEDMPHAFQLFEALPETAASMTRIGPFIKSRTVAVPLRLAAE